jgi:ubiquinone biosynthesis protein
VSGAAGPPGPGRLGEPAAGGDDPHDTSAGAGPSLSPDVAAFAFTAVGPWVIDPGQLRWNEGLDLVRAQTRADVPRLLEPHRLPPAGRLLRSVASLTRALGVWYVRERGTEFKKLRDQVPPEPFAAIRAVVEEDLGRPLDEVFAAFDREPIAAASIAQVHGAQLVTGEEVVVKVQRPQVAALMRADVRALAWLAPHLVGRIPVSALANPPALIELFAEQIVEELDFRLEAENMLDLARVFAETEQRAMVVPRPHPSLVTPRVLVMERLRGFAFDDVASMHHAGIDTSAVLRAGLIACLEGAMLYGVFHGDLHGGNLLVETDGRTVLFDFGITGRLTEPQRVAFLRLLLTGTAGDVKGQIAALRDLGAFPSDTDLDAVFADLELDRPVKDPTQMSATEMVDELQELVKKLLGYGARAPKELMLFVKNLMFLNAATAALAPDLDLIEEIVHIHQYFITHHGDRLARELGLDPTAAEVDVDAIKAGFMVPADVDRLTFADLQERRRTILKRMGTKPPRRR